MATPSVELQCGPSYLVSGAVGAGIDTATGGSCATADRPGLHVGSEIDVRVDLEPDDWTPTVARVIIGKNLTYGLTTPDVGWLLDLMVDGTLRFLWSPDGTFGGIVEAYSSVPVGLADGTRTTVRAVLAGDEDDPPGWNVTFFTGPSAGGPFTELGAVQTGSGAPEIALTTAPMEVGTTNGGRPGLGLSGNFQGKIYAAEVWDAFYGVRVCSPDFTALPPNTKEFTDSEGNLWLVAGSTQLLRDWVAVTGSAREKDAVTIVRGLSGEGSQADPSKCDFTLGNRAGDFSPRNPMGAYYGRLGRNTGARVSIPAAQNALVLHRGVHDYAYCPDSAAVSVAGDIDLRIDIGLPSWQGQYTMLIGKSLASGEYSYNFLLDDEGFLWLIWSANGTTFTSVQSTLPVPQPLYGRKTARATLDANDGAGGHVATFYVADSLDGPWDQARLGDVVTGAGTTSIHDSDSELLLAGYSPAYTGSAHARIYGARVYSGIGGTLVASPDFTAAPGGARQLTDAQGNLWRLAGGAEVSGRDDRFWGAVSAWPRRRDRSGADATVGAQAHGALRRLRRSGRLKSALRRGITSLGSALAAYWPCEEASGATVLASGIPGAPGMLVDGSPNLASSNEFACSESLPAFNGSRWSGAIQPYNDENEAFQVWFLLHIPEALAGETAVMRVWAAGSAVVFWQVCADAAGNLRLYGYDLGLAEVVDTGPVAFGATGKLLRVALDLAQDGADVDYTVSTLEVGQASGLTTSGTLAAATLGTVFRADANHEGGLGGAVCGHISVHREILSLFDLGEELEAHAGETAAYRLARLCAEEGIAAEVVGSYSDTPAMGPQMPGKLVGLLAECEAADMGILHEPRGFHGLRYVTRNALESQAVVGGPSLTLDYSAAQVSEYVPVDDDRYLLNEVEVSSPAGGEVVRQVTSGPLTQAAVGEYEQSYDLNLADQAGLPHHAEWRLHVHGTDEPRYPRLGVNLARAQYVADAALCAAVRELDIGGRLVVRNPPDPPAEDIEQLVIGTLEAYRYNYEVLEWVCVPEQPWHVGVYGDPGSRYDTQGSALAVAAGESDTTLVVRTTTGPAWQTVGDLPFDVVVGGERVTVTGVEGPGSPQAFTVTRSGNGVVKSHPAGTPVSVAGPVYYGLGRPSGLAGFVSGDPAPEPPPEPPPPAPEVTAVARINCGGPLYTDDAGNVWAADAHFSGGTVANQGVPDYGTDYDVMLQTERWGSFTYAIPFIPEGTATVVLHFAENFSTAAGQRFFDVTVNGVLALDNYDVFNEAGGRHGHISESVATTIPASGTCTIAFTLAGSPNNAAICMGIEVLAEGEDPPPPPPPPPPPSGFWDSGVTRPSVQGQYSEPNVNFWDTNFRGPGSPVRCTLTYTVRTGGWGDLVNPGYVLGNWTDPNKLIVIAQPMTPNGVAAHSQQAQAINTGAYDSYWRAWGNSLAAFVARGMRNPVTEIAWEFNGNWMYHSASNAAAFVSAFQRIVGNIRATHPTALIAFTPNAGYSQNPPSHDARDCYPGDSYVDYIGLDIYDHYPQAIGYSAINAREVGNTGRAKYWEAFADLHNKPMIIPEWALNNSTNDQAAGGRDNPDYIEWMWDWFEHLKNLNLMAGEAYYNDVSQVNVWSDLLSTGRNPNSRARYLSLWP